MLIVCPSCVSTYPAHQDGQAGQRCAHCRMLVGGEAADVLHDSRRGKPLLLGAAPGLDRPARQSPRRDDGGHRHGNAAKPVLAFCTAVGLGMAAVGWREPLTRAVPVAASLFDAVGLPSGPALPSLRDIHTALTPAGKTDVLTLDAKIANDTGESVGVPGIRIVVRDNAAQNLYSWTEPPPKQHLAAGEAVVFKTKLVSPPDARDLLIEFAEDTTREGTTSVKTSK